MVDYDALRKEVVTVFADRAVEVQGLVGKLQKTQRARAAQSHLFYIVLCLLLHLARHVPKVLQMQFGVRIDLSLYQMSVM